jgi:hypothetical protein
LVGYFPFLIGVAHFTSLPEFAMFISDFARFTFFLDFPLQKEQKHIITRSYRGTGVFVYALPRYFCLTMHQ